MAFTSDTQCHMGFSLLPLVLSLIKMFSHQEQAKKIEICNLVKLSELFKKIEKSAKYMRPTCTSSKKKLM